LGADYFGDDRVYPTKLLSYNRHLKETRSLNNTHSRTLIIIIKFNRQIRCTYVTPGIALLLCSLFCFTFVSTSLECYYAGFGKQIACRVFGTDFGSDIIICCLHLSKTDRKRFFFWQAKVRSFFCNIAVLIVVFTNSCRSC
jgi:hypothetical protein